MQNTNYLNNPTIDQRRPLFLSLLALLTYGLGNGLESYIQGSVLSVTSWGTSGFTKVLEDLSSAVSSKEDSVGTGWASSGQLVECHA